jgi:hypothetical protein
MLLGSDGKREGGGGGAWPLKKKRFFVLLAPSKNLFLPVGIPFYYLFN